MKIYVKLEVSESTNYKTFDLEDLDYSESEWIKLSKEQKLQIIEDAVHNLPEQPYWMVDTYKEQ